MIETILKIEPRTTTTGSGKSADEMVDELAEQILENLPAPLTREGSFKELFHLNKQGLMNSLTTFLMQEMVRFNRLLSVMEKSCEEIRNALKGLAVMSEELDQMYQSMLNNRVPEMWAEVAYPSLKPLGLWIQNLYERVEFLRDWLQKGKPTAFWIPAFFFPQGFITAVLQQYARKHHIAIDTLSFSFQVTSFWRVEDVNKSPGDGVYVSGLFLQCGSINTESFQLEEAAPGEKFSAVPIIRFVPEENYKPDPTSYACPVYKTSVRAGMLSTTGHSTNFIIMVELPSEMPPKHWILRGAALLCQVD